VGTLAPGDSGPNSFWVTEAQVHFALPARVSPYVGFGAGAAFFDREHDSSRFSPSGSVGLSVAVTRAWSTVGEMRIRGLGRAFQGTSAEFTFGVRRTL
ncbi:MAG: hypothetical protein RQ745_13290, partial [Longimicrobiales bacterium]|nr:hypothetical protein [Longimicrobiales bacterium]